MSDAPRRSPADLNPAEEIRLIAGAKHGDHASFEELVDRLWPGEKMTQASAQNRLQVSLSSLRSLGLREILQRTDKGYRLDPAHPVLVRPASEVGTAQAIRRTTRLGSSK